MPDRSEKHDSAGIAWAVCRPVLVTLTALLITLGVLYTGWGIVDRFFFAPPDPKDTGLISFTVPSGASVRTVASRLYGDPDDPGRVQFIRSRAVFQYIFEFLSQGHQIKAGDYWLSRSMTITDIIGVITLGSSVSDTMRIRLIEGMTVEEMAEELVAQKALDGTGEFLALCRSGEAFRDDFDFIAKLLDAGVGDRRYALEGYLFPDTYEIYTDATAEEIIRKMLYRTDQIFSRDAFELAGEQDVDMDWVLKMASLIEKEAKSADFEKVSAVFRNRLDEKMPLQSDVTVKYWLRIKRMALGSEDLAVDTPYNSYTNRGLPPSPIANPGRDAILAALMPDASFLEEGYLYFSSTDPETGVLAFSKTLEEHEEITAQYRPLWEEYDRKLAAQTVPPTPSPSPVPSAGRTPGIITIGTPAPGGTP